jgi:TorA maturation chaperone TorD
VTTATHGGVTLAALWRLLSLGFTSPREDTVAEVEVLAEALAEAGGPDEVEAVLEAVRSFTAEALSAQHASLFRGTVLVPPYEGSYEADPIRQGRQMADAAAFYRAFGAEAHGPTAERPDFVGCELEFLSFLELRRLAAIEAGEEGADLVEEIGDTFLADHAGRWLPTFFADVAREAVEAPYYRALAALGSRVLEEELARRGVEPAPLPRRRRRSSVERDSFECGAGTPAAPAPSYKV